MTITTLDGKKKYLTEKYCTNEIQEQYMEELGDEVIEPLFEIIEFLEGENNKEELSFDTILEQAMVNAIHTIDFHANNEIERKCPDVAYDMMHYKASGASYKIEMNDLGNVTLNLALSSSQYIILTLTESIEYLRDYVLENGVANEIIIKDILDNHLLAEF